MGVMSLKTAEYLLVHDPVVPIFPILHKKLNTPTIQGCPIVAGIGLLFERLGHWIDQYLQPLLLRLPGHIKDTTAVLASIKNMTWNDFSIWITMDVKALNSYIPHELALDAQCGIQSLL